MVEALAVAVVLGVATSPSLAAASPRVVVTLKPLHSLVAMVMDGVGTPTLLLSGATSPHVYTLRPSETRALAQADVVIWGGPALETFLQKPLSAIAGGARVIGLAEDAGLTLLPLRSNGQDGQDRERDDDTHGHSPGGLDMHFWLDVANAVRIVRHVAEALASLDPANAGTYWANARSAATDLGALDRELAATLAAVAGRPYLALHDAFQYVEARYGLRSIGILTVNPERVPGARTLVRLRADIAQSGVACVVGEPQFPPALARTVTEGSAARLTIVDSLGLAIPPGPDAYATTLRGLAQAFRACLNG